MIINLLMESIPIGDYILQNNNTKNMKYFIANENKDNYYNFMMLLIKNIENNSNQKRNRRKRRRK